MWGSDRRFASATTRSATTAADVADRAAVSTDPSPPIRWSWPAQLVGILVTFQLWCLAGVFFRAPDLATAFAMPGSLVTASWSWPEPSYALALCVPGFLAVDLAEEIHPGDGYAVASSRSGRRSRSRPSRSASC
jgi:hypothetical protein